MVAGVAPAWTVTSRGGAGGPVGQMAEDLLGPDPDRRVVTTLSWCHLEKRQSIRGTDSQL